MGKLEAIKARMEATEPGPWYFKHCEPCTSRGRLDAQVWGRGGNALIASWCDEDIVEDADGEFIAHSRQDVEDMLGALQLVRGSADNLYALADMENEKGNYARGSAFKFAAALMHAAVNQGLNDYEDEDETGS